MTAYIIPLVIVFILGYGLFKGVNVFDEFLVGAKEGIGTAVKIIPALIALLTCVGMFKVSGGLDVLTYAISPLTNLFHIPKEVIPLALLRPISGSGALCIYQDILAIHGANSMIGRIASVLMGSTETTFYTIAVYYGACSIKKTGYTVPAALLADFTGFILSSAIVFAIFG